MDDSRPLPTAGSSPTGLHGCPGREELIAFNRGTLPLAMIKSLATHIQHCPLCEANLSTLQNDGETRAILLPSDQEVNVQIEDSARLILVDLPIDFSRSGPSRLAKGSSRILEAPLQLGQYRLIEKIGQGGMGVVYKASHERLKREVAIKLLPMDKLDDAEGIERFQREMAAVGNVRHPNVVFATDAGESEGVHFLVMEYVEGIDLGKLVHKLGRLIIADACELIRQAAIGLDHIHRTGLVHRDLKPSNLMLSADGTVKIMDLGLAGLRPDLVEDDAVVAPRGMMGTIDYISPEQSRDASLADIRADVYSLGCTLFKLLCGVPPFSGDKFETVQEKLHGHRKLPPPKLSEQCANVSRSLESLVDRMLSKRAESRPSPRELSDALAPLATDCDLIGLLAKAQIQPQRGESEFVNCGSSHSTVSLLSRDQSSVVERPPPDSSAQPAFSHLSRRAWTISLIASVLLLLAVSVPIVYWAAGLGHRGGNGSEATGLLVLTPEFEKNAEFKWDGYRGMSLLKVHEAEQVLEASADGTQLIMLPGFPAGPGTLRVTLDQATTSWECSAGILLGVRNEVVPYDGVDQRMTVFQLISVHKIMGPKRTGPFRMFVRRHKCVIEPTTGDVVELNQILDSQQIPYPSGRPIELSLTMSKGRIDSIQCDGKPLERLTMDSAHAKYVPADFRGPLGLFNRGQPGTRFSNIEFLPL